MTKDRRDDEISAPKKFTREDREARNFLSESDANVPLSKSLEPYIPVGPRTLTEEPTVTLGTNTAERSPTCGLNAQSAYPATEQAHLDCANLSRMELRKKYPREANSHRNMLQRVTTQGCFVDPCIRKFRAFLMCVGPQTCRYATIVRIDDTDPEYAPGKIRWADMRSQNNNKGDTRVFHDPTTGERSASSRLAKLQGLSPSAIRKQCERGLTDADIIGAPASSRPETPPRPSWRRSRFAQHQRASPRSGWSGSAP